MTRSEREIALDVLVIGAGPAGLVSAKTLLEAGVSNIALVDETCSVGGLWNRAKDRQFLPCRAGKLEIPASSQPVYHHLRANFPKDLTSFLGYPFDSAVDFFPDPITVAAYCESYSRRFGLEQVLHLHTRVTHCTKDEATGLWNVKTVDSTNLESEKVFVTKRLLVCNGHFKKAFCPSIPGLAIYPGRLLHSSAFKDPVDFAKKSILIVGGYISGCDIAKILATYGSCMRIAVSVREWKAAQSLLLKPLRNKHGVVVRPGIDKISENGEVSFVEPRGKINEYSDTSSPTESPDVIIFATGYRYWFPFLPPGGYLSDPGGYKMTRLYKRILYIDDPSIAFIGITNQNLSPAISMEYQARWYTQKVVIENLQNLRNALMEKEVASRQDDQTQDALMLQFPAYCNSLAADLGIRGYWGQLFMDRFPLFLKSLWVRHSRSCQTGISTYWPYGVVGVAMAALLAFPSTFLSKPSLWNVLSKSYK